jgi:hypothetical protein
MPSSPSHAKEPAFLTILSPQTSRSNQEANTKKQISKHLENAGTLCPTQHRGIYKEQIMPDKLDSFLDRITRLVDEGNADRVIYLDFSKAFDTAPQVILQN